MLTDPIADFITRIRNASSAGKSTVKTYTSSLLLAIASVLKKTGFVVDVKVVEEKARGESSERMNKILVVKLNNEGRTLSLTRVSKPGQRIYVSHSEIRPVRSGLGIGIISTSQGVMTDSEARKAGIGGEYLCKVYTN
ncbi:30S ribosomal protein S8 [Candidatus Peregrinibacteria bacterium CG_4_9_14_0_2_um_filter_53_11]|nr:MAG: 30S ribosomal protein S8 [Candidatus Peregrinibacteria bacterium CG_4_9_14_0_2_um_filter_53_11]